MITLAEAAAATANGWPDAVVTLAALAFGGLIVWRITR